jgi:hypothetical protein
MRGNVRFTSPFRPKERKGTLNETRDTLAPGAKKMAAVFVVGAVMAIIWSAAKYRIVYRTVVDSLPPQLSSRYAFPVYALSASTPLPLQAEYVNPSGAGAWDFSVFRCAFSRSWNLAPVVSHLLFSAGALFMWSRPGGATRKIAMRWHRTIGKNHDRYPITVLQPEDQAEFEKDWHFRLGPCAYIYRSEAMSMMAVNTIW